MKQLVVISGKGGTGKTTMTASIASLAGGEAVVADCDVDAPDLHLLLKPEIRETFDFWGLQTAKIDPEKCTECGECEKACRFDAIHDFQVDPRGCEGCKVCTLVCPSEAINMVDSVSGHAYISETRFGTMVHADLFPGEEASGKLVTMVRELAFKVAEREKKDLVLIDGSPGIGCPVIASITGTDIALIMTEPSVSGAHDLERILGVTEHFGVEPLVCVNKHDLNPEMTDRIEGLCRDLGVGLAGKLPFDPGVVEAMISGKTLVEVEGPVGRAIRSAWERIKTKL
ncbi:MAG: ATP-binding protein [Methanothrix sp.]|jgi:MinD superfamily P-loop ATPase|uniref:Iron sulfur cluster/nucleotide binding domain protein n=1 Tax=Methanothrix harundinacea TaxID=301375 RepID=A0A101IIM6_9EURY|nr:MAG: (4Fe-4S)-binding protein [Methanosaeta sp. SDB]KUK44734.1 MAG: Iron sulfur cluster/nucleotide binding domain protein [Methanothrix harundinacea]MDD2639260.1 ATP-binding protein [Methanothrix sp.]MDI9399030.1 ATP-binding protein [Euryarchaeota archaeon]KUK95933.1 MAG: Iron sulfur cluster/nucleotide binding domain protein [Methanothrix harundinacea]